jgi:hypothetical protein
MTDTDKITFTAEEFASYWESHQDDIELGINFMIENLKTPNGRDLLANTATVLAVRHGVSSSKVVTFRQTMRRASKKAGLDVIYTPSKVKGTGTKKNPHPTMVVEAAAVGDGRGRKVDVARRLNSALKAAVDAGWDEDSLIEAVRMYFYFDKS